MTGAEVQTAWFTPFHYFAYLFIILVLTVVYCQWQWTRKCDKEVKVLVVYSDGSTGTEYAPKEGSSISLVNPKTRMTRLWPMAEIATVEMLYPGDGFIPVFLQKKIRTIIVDNDEWEPLLNRGSYLEGVASPDVKELLLEVAEMLTDGKAKEKLSAFANRLKTAPTREMIASPAVLGNLMQEKISELAVTVAKDIVNPLNEAIKKLGQRINPTIVYIGLGLTVILLVYVVYQLSEIAGMDVSSLSDDIQKIKVALGVAE